MDENTNILKNQYFVPCHIDKDYKWDLVIEMIKDKSVPINVIRNLRHIDVKKVYSPDLLKANTVVRLIDHSADTKEGQNEQIFHVNTLFYRNGDILTNEQEERVNKLLPKLSNNTKDDSYEIIEFSNESIRTKIKETVKNKISVFEILHKGPEFEVLGVNTTISGFLYTPIWHVEITNGTQIYKYDLDGDFDDKFLQNAEQAEHPLVQILEMVGLMMLSFGNNENSGNRNYTIEDTIDSVINADRLDHKLVAPVTWIAVILFIDFIVSIVFGVPGLWH